MNTPNVSIRVVNRDSLDFPNVAHHFMVGFERKFEENPFVFNRINCLDLLQEELSTVVAYHDGVPVAGLLVDSSIPAEWRLKGLWAIASGAGRATICATKTTFAKLDNPRVWRAHVRIDRLGMVNHRPVSALQFAGYRPERVRAFSITGANADRHLAHDADEDGRYRALEFVRNPSLPLPEILLGGKS